MRKNICLVMIAVVFLLMGSVVYAEGSDIQQVSVLDYGAKGDGITDDTNSIQEAIDYASENNMTVFFPSTGNHYIISRHIVLNSNTHIESNGATIFMEAQDSPDAIFYSDDDEYISNITIEGINFMSTNSKNGTGIEANSKTSNIEAVCIYGVNGLTVKNVQMDNMSKGLKLGPSQNGVENTDISIDNLNIYNTRIPIFTSSTNSLRISNSILDANGGSDQRLHCVYIEGDTSDYYFDNVVFKNAPGGGIHIYNESEGKRAGKNMTFINCTIENCKVGVYIWSGAEDIKILKTTIEKCDTAFYVNVAFGLVIDEIDISDFTQDFGGDMGAFLMTYNYDSSISNVNIDSDNMGGSLFDLGDEVENLSVSAVKVKNMNDNKFFNAQYVVKGLKVEDSSFEWNKITNQRLSFRAAGTEATFRNNSYINLGETFDSLCLNYSGTNVVMENNSYAGFESLQYMKDDATNVNIALGTANDSVAVANNRTSTGIAE